MSAMGRLQITQGNARFRPKLAEAGAVTAIRTNAKSDNHEESRDESRLSSTDSVRPAIRPPRDQLRSCRPAMLGRDPPP